MTHPRAVFTPAQLDTPVDGAHFCPVCGGMELTPYRALSLGYQCDRCHATWSEDWRDGRYGFGDEPCVGTDPYLDPTRTSGGDIYP